MSPKQKQSELQTWFDWLVEWVKGFIRKINRKNERILLTIEVIHSRNGKAVAESVQRATPGAVATWYIAHTEHPNVRLIITLDNLRELQRFIDSTLPTDQHIRTHIISIQWLVLLGKNQKTIYRFVGAWVGDLQGQTNSIDSKAFEVVRYLAKEILNLPSVASMNWRYRVENYPWEDTIVSKCKLVADKHDPKLIKIRQVRLKSGK